ncbi:grasp-with-spasm system SPASM domain peptide maturase [Tenacibaculum sp. TC6]|uniref:grasp-with-spasm system SPASM domain peptide maturase n=1 Tax=Tenacibaculum sp. TC6 TaxID=3423223 RepID=UPI003D359E85
MINNSFFVLSSSCKVVKGIKRSLIIDYLRNELYFISNEYYDLIHLLNRKKVDEIENKIDIDSRQSFIDFIDFLIINEIGFFTKTLEEYPIREEQYDDELVLLKDVIFEVDENNFSETMFIKLINEIDELRCNDLQLRFLSEYNLEFQKKILDIIDKTNINYIEIHFTYSEKVSIDNLNSLILKYSPLSHIYIYNSPKSEIIDLSIRKEVYYPLHFGKLYFIQYPFNKGKCCGVINKENLNFENINNHTDLEKNNGCLNKKVSIDSLGNIRNCPVMDIIHGNLKQTKIKDIIKQHTFNKFWKINKTQIDTCKGCEFRFNCTDCRAFIENPLDLYSKPLKCGYNPSTCTWKDWSLNPLKQKVIQQYGLV